ncbi:MAG: nucleotidyltransferase domain-containing protein [Anaerolineae bacterium]|nr:nucleotidyltransferase domain-containing protein [Anaerolineae bacterium]
MATISPAVKQSMMRFLAAVQQRQRIVMAYLYGSQVKGTATEWSDIDLALVSPDFAPDLFAARVALLRLAAQIDDRIEPHPFAPEDFTVNHPLASEIRQTGVRLV